MPLSFVTILGIILMAVGGVVSILFWIPKVVNRPRLKELLGSRYPMIYVIYMANGPMLLLLGLLILLFFGQKA